MGKASELRESAAVDWRKREAASEARGISRMVHSETPYRVAQNSASGAKLVINEVSRSFTTRSRQTVDALGRVSFAVGEGEFLCILGPSGCGKSTLLRMIAGFVQPSSGQVLYDGQLITGPSAKRAMVFQDYALFQWMTVFDNVAFGLVAKKVARKDREARVMELLDFVGLSKFVHHYPHQLSGGMQQRIALARALAPDPDVVLLDEPFGALDLLTREVMQEEMLRLQKYSGKTFVLVTHSVEEAVFLGTRVLLFSAAPGTIREDVAIDLPEPRTNALRTENRKFLDYREHLSVALRQSLASHGK